MRFIDREEVARRLTYDVCIPIIPRSPRFTNVKAFQRRAAMEPRANPAVRLRRAADGISQEHRAVRADRFLPRFSPGFAT